MSFLAPLFLLGGLAIVLPVVFHLIRRTSRERMPFSSLMFLQPTPPRVTRRSRLENIWLLVLRCLVLCLLAFGFARPFFPKPMADDPPAAAGRKIVLLIDTSASMRRAALWADARAKAGEVLKKASPADQVAVFTFDRQVNRLISFEQWSAMSVNERAALAGQQLAAITPGWAGTDLGGALITAVEALEEKAGRADTGEGASRRQIVLISDFQEGSHLEALQAFEWPRRIELMVESLKARSSTLSAGDLKDARAFATNLKNPANEVSAYIHGRLRESTRQDLAKWPASGEVPSALQRSVIEDINAIISGPSIWDRGRFANVAIRQETRDLLKGNPTGLVLARLNRLLLEDAYPSELSRKRADHPTNAGVQIVLNREETDTDAGDAGLRVRVSNSSESRQEQFVLRWERDGTAQPGATEVYVPPGQSRVVPAPKTPSGMLEERLVLAGDDEDFDNIAYLVPPQAEQIRVLYLGNEAGQDTAQPLFYVQRAFQQTRRQIVQVVPRRTDTALAARDLEALPLAIITDTLPEAQLAVVREFLRAGRTALLVLKNASAAGTVARLVDGTDIRCAEAVASRYALLGQVDFQHPLFAPFADPRFSDFTKIHFWKHRQLETNSLPQSRVLAGFDNGDAALLHLPVGKGALFVLTSGWHPPDSQLALSSKFVPLLYSLLNLSGGIKAQLAQYQVGDEVVLAAAAGGQPLTVRKPDGTEVRLSGERKFMQTDRPGIYTVSGGPAGQRFAVNLDPAESKTALLPVEELEHLGVTLKPPEINLARQLDQKRHLQNNELESRQKLWRWLIVATFLILIVETWLADRLTRPTTA